MVYATVNGQLVEENRGGTVTEYVPDTLGSVIQTTDSSGGQTSSATYWPYGEINTSSGSNPSPWKFVGTWGYYLDSGQSGSPRFYIRARDYRPDLSRWLTVDPLWPKEPKYLYAYTDPLNWIDPTGDWCIRVPIFTNPFRPLPWPLPSPGHWNPVPVSIRWCPGSWPKVEISPVYGKYCGPQTTPGVGPGVDQVDQCCANHDNCFAMFGCTAFNQVFNLNCRNCTQDLCNCLIHASCGWDFQCWRAKATFAVYACSPVFGNPWRSL